jgi:anti-sigma regulatory factor (Ser/Thr protein kinase)
MKPISRHEGEPFPARWSVELEPDFGRLADARTLVDTVADLAGVSGRTRYMLKLAVHEALVNAMQHGARFAAPVWLTACLDAQTVSFAVGDPGDPFDLEPDHAPGLQDRGRGLLLILSCMDEVTQAPLERGKEVRLLKWLP